MTRARDIGTMFGGGQVETFMGLPKAADPHRLNGAQIALIGAPCATPYPSVGAYCAGGPAAIRAAIAPYSANLTHIDFDLGEPLFPGGRILACDLGDLPCREATPEANRRSIRDTVKTVLDQKAVPILIGGDDSVPIPMFEAYAGHGEFIIVQIDAHIDWRNEVGGETLGLSSNMRRASEMSHIKGIIQAGQRAVGSARPEDYHQAISWGAQFVSAREIARHGIAPILDLVPQDANVVIAFDCDGLDPSIMPGVIGRAPGGLSYGQMIDLIHGIAAKARIAGFDIVEFMPERDIDQIGALTAARVIVNVIGAVARQQQ